MLIIINLQTESEAKSACLISAAFNYLFFLLEIFNLNIIHLYLNTWKH